VKSRVTPAERRRRAHVRQCVLRHFDEVTRNVSQTCRPFGISRSQFYFWRERYQNQGEYGLVERKRGPRDQSHSDAARNRGLGAQGASGALGRNRLPVRPQV
jgi:transposase-like protein